MVTNICSGNEVGLVSVGWNVPHLHQVPGGVASIVLMDVTRTEEV